MKISDLEIVIENPSGSYKKFADTLDEYPVLGVTFPTHYGYIKGFASEDDHDLDVFIGNGDVYGTFRVERDDVPGGIETKFLLGINDKELSAIKTQFGPVVHEVKTFDQEEFFTTLEKFKRK